MCERITIDSFYASKGQAGLDLNADMMRQHRDNHNYNEDLEE